MALLVELGVMVIIIGGLGGIVAALAQRSTRPGATSVVELLSSAFTGRVRSLRSSSNGHVRSSG